MDHQYHWIAHLPPTLQALDSVFGIVTLKSAVQKGWSVPSLVRVGTLSMMGSGGRTVVARRSGCRVGPVRPADEFVADDLV